MLKKIDLPHSLGFRVAVCVFKGFYSSHEKSGDAAIVSTKKLLPNDDSLNIFSINVIADAFGWWFPVYIYKIFLSNFFENNMLQIVKIF